MARQHGALGGSAGPVESETERLETILRIRSPWKAFKGLDEYVEERVRHFLRKRHKVSSQGTRQFSTQRIYGELGVLRPRGPVGGAAS